MAHYRHIGDIILSLLFAVSLFFFIITVSISLPIFCRPFYYAHIDAMGLPESSGYTKAEIKEAYDDVLDYLTLPGKEFSAGEMKFSSDGAAHFSDCKVLFDLNTMILLSSACCLLVLIVLRKVYKGNLYRLGKHSSAFWASIAAVVLPVVIGMLAALDFDRAFVIFHNIFFPGKENWLLNQRTDHIIRVLPQDFFMHCAILIGFSVLLISLSILLIELTQIKKGKRYL